MNFEVASKYSSWLLKNDYQVDQCLDPRSVWEDRAWAVDTQKEGHSWIELRKNGDLLLRLADQPDSFQT